MIGVIIIFLFVDATLENNCKSTSKMQQVPTQGYEYCLIAAMASGD